MLSNTEAVKELYDNMLQSVNVKRTMPPNASLWSMIENCKNHEDIKLLFDVLQNLRRFVSSFSLQPCFVSLFSFFLKCWLWIDVLSGFGCSDCQTSEFIPILIVISAKKLPGHVLV